MRTLKFVWRMVTGLLRQAWLFPGTVAVALRDRRRNSDLDAREAERLDRIRQPWKYQGK